MLPKEKRLFKSEHVRRSNRPKDINRPMAFENMKLVRELYQIEVLPNLVDFEKAKYLKNKNNYENMNWNLNTLTEMMQQK